MSAQLSPAGGFAGRYCWSQRARFLLELKAGGRVRSLVIAPAPQDPIGASDAAFVSGSYDGTVLTELAQLVAAGELRLEIPRVFPLSQVGRALALSESGHARGKIVLSMHEL